MNGAVSVAYAGKVAAGILQSDPVQLNAAHALDRITADIKTNQGKWFFEPKNTVNGLYLWGGVGRGKSMLMELFVEGLPGNIKAQRVHFHAFMRDMHRRIHEWRQLSIKARRALPYFVRGAEDDPIPHLAKYVAQNYKILAFDEFHVTQIADAMLLSRLFTALFEADVIIVATSNRAPEDLYVNGLNRGLFLPFIDVLRAHCDIFALSSPTDYRLETLYGETVWHVAQGSTPAIMHAQWDTLTAGFDTAGQSLDVQGRTLTIPKLAGDVAWMTFDDLCGKPLGASDYLVLCDAVRVLFLADIPQLNPENRNEAARFVALVDVMYETQTILVGSAATLPDTLYLKGDGAFEFQRTISRLIEMQSQAYLEKLRVPKAQSL